MNGQYDVSLGWGVLGQDLAQLKTRQDESEPLLKGNLNIYHKLCPEVLHLRVVLVSSHSSSLNLTPQQGRGLFVTPSPGPIPRSPLTAVTVAGMESCSTENIIDLVTCACGSWSVGKHKVDDSVPSIVTLDTSCKSPEWVHFNSPLCWCVNVPGYIRGLSSSLVLVCSCCDLM